ncbi:MAG: PEP-CTERM sorting domain-containing protein [Verrucomicrobiota bacterium]
MTAKGLPTTSVTLGSAATAAVATLIPQHGDAAIVTVGGDGAVGTVQLFSDGSVTNIGGLLVDFLSYQSSTSFNLVGINGSQFVLADAVRSSISTSGGTPALGWVIYAFTALDDGAVGNSADNWVPGRFRLNGVNDTNPVWGWLHIQLENPVFGQLDPTILSFTYDDAATDATPFAKPVGGFVIPEPSSVSLLALGAGGVLANRKRRKQT